MGKIDQSNANDRVAGEMALHCTVIDGVIERGHDHGLIERQPAMTYRASHGIERVIEASVGAVEIRV